MFWVLCTGCLIRPAIASRKFYLASCTHMFCEQCVNLSVPYCKRCRTAVNLTICDSTMSPELRGIFNDPREKVLNVVKAFDYQLNSMHGLFSHFRHSAENHAYVKSYAEQAKNELDNCKQKLEAAARKYRELEIANETLKMHLRKTRAPATKMAKSPAAAPDPSHGWLSQLGLENDRTPVRTPFTPASCYDPNRKAGRSPVMPRRPSPVHPGMMTPSSSMSSSFYRSPRCSMTSAERLIGSNSKNSFGLNRRF
ncbi:zinc ion Hypothetical protein [Nesidiocoris tenuis]|uniref:RING-type domain-containing protein n=1 Tax=Nesidiocoris tenuis TaxID=355587 RepID=A0ABN7ASJ2_9HEMI|nr:zinc ion Hypothetical protein [Nesidiocoris tenuis]